MKRILAILAVGVVASLVFSAGALAAPALEFSGVEHAPSTVAANDESFAYSLKLKNVGDQPTTGSTTVAVDLPSGLQLAEGKGTGWSCNLGLESCSSSSAVAAGAQFPTLTLRVWVLPGSQPANAAATFTASGGGSAGAIAADSFAFGPAIPFAITDFEAQAEDQAGDEFTVAGGHPFAATSSFFLTTHLRPSGDTALVEGLRDLFFDLPPGFIGNPLTADVCTVSEVQENSPSNPVCPESAAVGGAGFELKEGTGNESQPIYRVVPEDGFVAAFAVRPVNLGKTTVVLRIKVRSNGDYGVTAVAPLPPQNPEFTGARFVTLCGYGANAPMGILTTVFAGCKEPGDDDANLVPFLTNPTRCAGAAPVTSVAVDSFQHPGAQDAEGFPVLSDPAWKSLQATASPLTGCAALTEAWVGEGAHPNPPTFDFQPDTVRAAAPAAYRTSLHIPQTGLLSSGGLATAHLKATTVLLPEGVVLNPSAANGLEACSPGQIGLVGTGFPAPNPIHFNTTSAGCPEGSKIGTVEVSTPLLDKPLKGAIYLAAQNANPFGSKFAVYIVIEDPESGVVVKLAGKVSPDPVSGRITATFDYNPQVPFEDLELDFFSGPRASLSNPDVCGTVQTRTELAPWSAQNPDAPDPSEIAVSESPVTIALPPAGASSCPASKAARPFGPSFSAGVTNPTAGAHSPFVLDIKRNDGEQELSAVEVTLPRGLLGSLKGIALCSQASIDAAGAPGRSGIEEIARPSCPASSQVGTTTVVAGAGDHPFVLKTGRAYLTGPYKGAPLGIVFLVPAVAGPFDLGVQVVRTALQIDPKTAQVTAKSDPLPQILDGVPVQVREVQVDVDRAGFQLNPTNCAPMAVEGRISGASGAVANVANRFQVGGCAALTFGPKLAIQLRGGTKRGAYQQLTATYMAKPGEANASRIAVTFPHSAFLAQEHINTICTRVQFAAGTCPPGSVYGSATATTPLLDEQLSGPVYLRSNPEHELPDLVVALEGPAATPVKVELSGRTDSQNEGIRNTFDFVPDAPVSKFTLKLKGGRKSLIVNSRDLCAGKQRATVRMNAQNGRTYNFRPLVTNSCSAKKSGKRAKRLLLLRPNLLSPLSYGQGGS